MSLPEVVKHCGALPFATALAALTASRLGRLAFPEGAIRDQVVAGLVLSSALFVVGIRILSFAHWLTPLGVTILVAAPLPLLIFSRPPNRSKCGRKFWSRDSVPLAVAAIAGIFVAAVAAYWLPIWQWDALGYHLPYVNFALSARTLDGVPGDVPYLSSYPHNVELFMIGFRALLHDDVLVDAAQIPFGVAGAAVIAALARRQGALRPHAVAAGCAWITVPAVLLQLPTDYVDVAATAFFLMAAYFTGAPSSARSLLLSGAALGLYLGTKPNAPLGVAVLGSLLALRGLRERRFAATALAILVTLALGGESYLRNIARYGNPVWPVRLDVGPLHFPGLHPMSALLESGASAPHLTGPLAVRILRSWTSLTSLPAFDMRIGGFGPLFLCCAPVAVLLWTRRRDGLSWAILGAALASPDPAVARYVLAVPALVFAAAASAWRFLPTMASPWTGMVAAAAALWQVAYAWPGFAGDGPPLSRYAALSSSERESAVGANGSPAEWIALRRRIRPRESFAYDASMELPYLAWDSAMTYDVVWIPSALSLDAIGTLLDGRRARIVVAGDGTFTFRWLRARPEQFTPLFHCRSAPCWAFARR